MNFLRILLWLFTICLSLIFSGPTSVWGDSSSLLRRGRMHISNGQVNYTGDLCLAPAGPYFSLQITYHLKKNAKRQTLLKFRSRRNYRYKQPVTWAVPIPSATQGKLSFYEYRYRSLRRFAISPSKPGMAWPKRGLLTRRAGSDRWFAAAS